MWQVTPGTLGSSNSLTQTLSLGESSLKVVLTHARSSARARVDAARNRANAIKKSLMVYLPLAEPAQIGRAGPCGPALPIHPGAEAIRTRCRSHADRRPWRARPPRRHRPEPAQ